MVFFIFSVKFSTNLNWVFFIIYFFYNDESARILSSKWIFIKVTVIKREM